MTSDLKQSFDRDGFVVVPGVLSPEEIQRLRTFFLELFDAEPIYEGDNKLTRVDIAARYPETRFLMWKPELVEAARALLGEDFVFIPEMSAHDAHFGDWHKDTDAAFFSGEGWTADDDVRLVEAAFYLQDNDEHGGGLDVVRGSNRFWPKGPLGRLRQRLYRRRRPYSIPSKAGDLVLFDFRTDHRATPAPAGPKTGA